MSKTTKWVIGIIGIFVLIFTMFLLVVISGIKSVKSDKEIVSSSTGGEKIALVEIKETILSSEEIVRQIKKFRENRDVRALLIRIESPGGGVAASQEIYEEIKKTRSIGRPVVVSMGAVAASGGYYIACGANKIVANPGTITGSIGVIFQFMHFNQLMDKIGVDATTIKSGKFKDAGSPFRKTTEEEKQYFNMVIQDVYEQFVEVVVNERNMSREKVVKYADGRIFTGRQAYEYGFVDTLGTYEDAIKIAADLGGIQGKPNIIKEIKRKGLFETMFTEASTEIVKIKQELLNQPVIQYKFSTQN